MLIKETSSPSGTTHSPTLTSAPRRASRTTPRGMISRDNTQKARAAETNGTGNSPHVDRIPQSSPSLKPRRRGRKVCAKNILRSAPATLNEGEAPASQSQRITTLAPDAGDLAILRTFARQRRLLVDMRTAANNSVGGYIRSFLGFRWDMPKKQRDAISKKAGLIRSGKLEAPPDVAALVDTLKSSVAPIEARIKVFEKQICAIVRKLPAWGYISEIGGIAEISVGSLIGAAGDLSRFRSPEGLFRVLGLSAPTDTPADWYRPQGRCVAWCLGDGMIKAKSRYKALYDERKASTEVRIETKGKFEGKPWSKNHRHRDAHRIMTKRMLAELWAVWTGNVREK